MGFVLFFFSILNIVMSLSHLFIKKNRLKEKEIKYILLPSGEDVKDLINLIRSMEKRLSNPLSICIFMDGETSVIGVSNNPAMVSANCSIGYSTSILIHSSIEEYKEKLLTAAETDRNTLDKLIDKHKYLLE